MSKVVETRASARATRAAKNKPVAPPHQPLVTIYIVNHNYGRYLEQAIESVLTQTLTDFELIIIDDGSTDESQQVIERYVDRERVVTIFQHNKGLTVSNNIALRAARGRYIIRLDADDYLDPHALQVLSTVLERDPKVGLVFPDYYLVDVEGKVMEIVRRHDFGAVTLLDQPAHGACTMIRVDCLREVGGYDESLRCQDGYDLWIRFVQKYAVQNVNLPLFYYRKHRTSLTTNEDQLLETRARILSNQARKLPTNLSTVAIIPVRGQRTDPGSMALRPLAGRPLLDWTIDEALQAERISDVVVTSPDEDVLDHVRETYGEQVLALQRDPKLALLNSRIEATILGALEAYEAAGKAEPDVLALLYVDSPFRLARHIDSAVDVMELFSTDIVVAVRPETDMFYRHDGGGLQPLRSGADLRLEAEELYRQVGDLRLVRTGYLRSSQSLTAGKIGHIVMDERSAFSVLTEWHWQVAEMTAAALPRRRKIAS